MNSVLKKVANIMTLIVLVFAFNIVAFAQGTTTIALSKNSAAVGDTVKVKVTSTESGSITVKYTASMLNFTDCDVSGYSSEGNSVTFSGKEGTITFNAASSGTASIIVSSSANSGSSATITIGSTSTADTSTTQQTDVVDTTASETEETDASETTDTDTDDSKISEEVTTQTSSGAIGTLNSNGGFDINGVAYVVSERYSDSEVPSGFSKTTITIGSSTYSEPTNGSITLLYLKPADNTAGSGVFYLYDAEAGTVSEFLMLGSSDNYVIISNSESGPSSSFTATTLDVTGGTATAYTIDGSEFFYVYGVNQDGVSGWYVYDITYKTLSRVDESALSSTSSTESDTTDTVTNNDDNSIYVSKLNLYRKIIMGLIILCVVLVFIIINKALKGRNEEDDDFDGDVFSTENVKKSGVRLPRSIVFGKHEDSDDEYDDEEYDDNDEYDEEYDDYEADDEEYEDSEDEINEADLSRARYESESYDARRASSLNMMDLNDL